MISNKLKKIGLIFFLLTTGLILPSAHSANWLMLQGTEPAGQATRVKVWGFIQPEYQSTGDTKLKAGPWAGQKAVFNQIRPDLINNETFGIIRARIGIRGTGDPLDSNVNYFILAEFGDNAITHGGGGSSILTDASVTLSHIPGARVRVGQFKTPGSEEGLQAVHVFDYINFTNVTNGLLLQRFFDGDGSDPNDPNHPNGPVGAFRDIGIQVFDTFNVSNWEHSYAVMYGNGNGISRGNNNDSNDLYLYWSSEQVYGGSGTHRDGWKVYIWSMDGKRTFTKAGAGKYDHKRFGLGTTFRKDKYRAAFEYITADGMIFNGTDGGALAGSLNNAGTETASFNIETDGEADGWYVHFGYAILPAVELDIRYDIYNRMTNVSAKESRFDTLTLGAQYFFNKKTRVLINYELRGAEAPNLPGGAVPNQVLDSIDDRIAVQMLAIF